jgi:hypothetical protein
MAQYSLRKLPLTYKGTYHHSHVHNKNFRMEPDRPCLSRPHSSSVTTRSDMNGSDSKSTNHAPMSEGSRASAPITAWQEAARSGRLRAFSRCYGNPGWWVDYCDQTYILFAKKKKRTGRGPSRPLPTGIKTSVK